MSSFLHTYKKFLAFPFGSRLFDIGIGFVAPFFGKIRPHIVKLEPSLCIVEMNDRRGLRNHFGTINAGALCTLAELTGGMALDATIPAQLRWIPKAMTVQYLAKAKGKLTATSQVAAADVVEGNVIVTVVVTDLQDQQVFTADITFYVSKRKS